MVKRIYIAKSIGIIIVMVLIQTFSFATINCSEFELEKGIAVEKYNEENNINIMLVSDTIAPVEHNWGSEVFKVVSLMPRFPGCEDMTILDEKKSCSQKKMLQYIYSNLKYPQEARENGIKGTVVLQFIIRPDGSVTDISLIREIGGGCGKSAVEVIQSMNDNGIVWIPGSHKGVNKSVYKTLPIKFRLP